MVSQAARVGAMTMTRPVGGSAETKAWWSGGRERSVGVRTGRITHEGGSSWKGDSLRERASRQRLSRAGEGEALTDLHFPGAWKEKSKRLRKRQERIAFVHVGTLDEPAALQPRAYLFTRSMLPWVMLPVGVPASEASTESPGEARTHLEDRGRKAPFLARMPPPTAVPSGRLGRLTRKAAQQLQDIAVLKQFLSEGTAS